MMPSAHVLMEPASPPAVVPATRIGLVVEYDGTRYFGFQLQKGQPTVQAALEKAIFQLTGEERRVVAASRTDTGVHALGQVVSFRTGSSLPASTFVSGLNYYLPRDVAVCSAHRLSDGFHVQRSALSRCYEYRILNRSTRSPLLGGHCHLVKEPLDTARMNEAASRLVGEHDFASFTSVAGTERRSTVRRIFSAGVDSQGEVVTFHIAGSSFLLHQVRNMAGMLIEVGLGRIGTEDIVAVLERRQPGLAGPKAPAVGLYLVRVDYARPFEEGNEDIQH